MTGPARSFRFLVNPRSGGGAAAEAVVPVAKLLRERGARVEVTYSPGPRAVLDLATAAVQAGDVVVSVGGDGMLSSLVGRMAQLRDAGGVLGLVPAGRGNDFARMLGVPQTPPEVAGRLLGAQPHRVDLIECERRVVAGSVYSGVDARAAAMVAAMERVPRPCQYPLAAMRALARYVPHRYRLTVDGETCEVEAATVVVANSGFYGSGMRISPSASLTDGLVEVVVIGAASRLALMRAFPKIYDGSHVEHPAVTVMRGRSIQLTALSPRPVPVGGDGEDLGMLPGPGQEPLRMRVLPGALTVL